MKCVICDEEILEKSEEHVIPEAIGGKITFNGICKTCNKKLGAKVDFSFTENALMVFIRAYLGIKNKDKKTISFIDRLKWKGLDGENKERVVKNGKFLAEKVGIHVYTPPYISDDLSIIRFENIEDLEKHLEREKIDINLDEYKISVNITNVQLQCDFEINYKFLALELIKIAYEIAIKELGINYIDDEIGNKYKKILFNELYSVNELIEYADYVHVSFNNGNILKNIINTMNITILNDTNNKAYMYIRLFNIITGTVLLSNNSKKFDALKNNGLIEVVK